MARGLFLSSAKPCGGLTVAVLNGNDGPIKVPATMLNLNTPPVMQNGTLEDNCAFWDKEGYDWP